MEKFSAAMYPIGTMGKLLVVAALFTMNALAQDTPKAVVHFYRSGKFLGSALSPSIYLDREKLAKLLNGETFDVHVIPGRYVLRTDDGRFYVEHPVKFVAGHEYFVRLEVVGTSKSVLFGTGGHLQLDVVPEEEALPEIKKLKVINPNKLHEPTAGPLPDQD